MALTPVTQQSTLAKIQTDPLKNFKFHVKIYHAGLQDRYPQLGFMSVSGLSVTTDVIVYRQGGHNAQPLSANVLTHNGFKRMGDIVVGDMVHDPDGEVSKVTGVYPQGRRPVYRITVADGASTEACHQHLWKVRVGDEPARVVDTLKLAHLLDSKPEVTLPPLAGAVMDSVPDVPEEAASRRRVAAVEYIRDEDVQCISVSADSHLYVTDGFIPTHNTTTQKMPGQSDFSPITLSRGLVPGDSDIYSWLQQIFMVIQGTGGTDGSKEFRSTLDIMLVDHPVTTTKAAVKAAWRVYNAWPTSIAWGDLDAGANGVELQQITLAHEGIDFKIASKGGNGPSGGVSFA